MDVIAENGSKLMPIEIKFGKTLTGESFAGLKKWLLLAQNIGDSPTLIYGGAEHYKRQDIQIYGWQESGNVF